MRLRLLFPTVKTAALYLISIKSYSKNIHPPFFLEWTLESNVLQNKIFDHLNLLKVYLTYSDSSNANNTIA